MCQAKLECRVGRTGLRWQPHKLEGYELSFDKVTKPPGCGYATLKPQEGGVVWGVLYLLTEKELTELDKSEGVPKHYTRETLTVSTCKDPIEAICYFASPDKTKSGLKPTKDYLRDLIDGVLEHDLPDEYVQTSSDTCAPEQRVERAADSQMVSQARVLPIVRCGSSTPDRSAITKITKRQAPRPAPV